MALLTVEQRAFQMLEKELEREITELEKIVFSDACSKWLKYQKELFELARNFDHVKATPEEGKAFLARFEWLQKAIEINKKHTFKHQEERELASKQLARARRDLDEVRNKLGLADWQAENKRQGEFL